VGGEDDWGFIGRYAFKRTKRRSGFCYDALEHRSGGAGTSRQRHRKRSRNFAAFTWRQGVIRPHRLAPRRRDPHEQARSFQMNTLRGVKGPVVRRSVPLAPPSVVPRIVLITPAAFPVYRRWDCGRNPRFAGACNVDGIGQGSRSCISKSGIFRSLNIEPQPIRIKSIQH